MRVESVQEFLARGGEIKTVNIKDGYKMPNELRPQNNKTKEQWKEWRKERSKYHNGSHEAFWTI